MPVKTNTKFDESEGSAYLTIEVSPPISCFINITVFNDILLSDYSYDNNPLTARSILSLDELFAKDRRNQQPELSKEDLEVIRNEISKFIRQCYENKLLQKPDFKKFLANKEPPQNEEKEPTPKKPAEKLAEEIYNKREEWWRNAKGNKDKFFELVKNYVEEHNYSLDGLLKHDVARNIFAKSSVLRLINERYPGNKEEKNTHVHIAEIIYNARDELWEKAEAGENSQQKILLNFVKEIYKKAKSEGGSLEKILNDPQAKEWFDKSGRLKLAKKIFIEFILPDLSKGHHKRHQQEPADESQIDKAKAERRVQKEVRALAQEHFQAGKGLQTQLKDKGFAVDIKDKDQIKRVVRMGLLRAHPDRGGDPEEAQFFNLLKDLNDKDVLRDYDRQLQGLRKK